MGRSAILAALATLLLGTPVVAAGRGDPTATALEACLARPDAASTGGQTDCQRTALAAYDRRMNLAYDRLLKALPSPAGRDLRASQRAWIAFRDAEAVTRTALFETRHGTMYVPMQAQGELELTRDRALTLEGYRQVLAIDG
jgi:uncharacterized protein YecT (DUF1311 family)